jgi:thioredoxin 2
VAATSVITCVNCGRRNRLTPRADGIPRCGHCHEALPWLVAADDDSFAAEIAAPVPVLVDLWAAWCGPCRMVAPALEELARDHRGRLKVVKVDIDANPGVAERHEVRGIPLLLLFRDGSEVDRFVGAAPKRSIESWLGERVDLTASAPS